MPGVLVIDPPVAECLLGEDGDMMLASWLGIGGDLV